MAYKFIADIILIIHFLVVLFIASLFVLVPAGYKFNWTWQKNFKLRSIHLLLIFFITLETIIGITCPLTMLENHLRGVLVSNDFIDLYISKIIFWDFPPIFFLTLYFFCLIWTVFIWIKFPPNKYKI